MDERVTQMADQSFRRMFVSAFMAPTCVGRVESAFVRGVLKRIAEHDCGPRRIHVEANTAGAVHHVGGEPARRTHIHLERDMGPVGKGEEFEVEEALSQAECWAVSSPKCNGLESVGRG